MTEQVLNILKFVLLGLLYLFFARVLWAVWSEVRTPRRAPAGSPRAAHQAPRAATGPYSPTAPTVRPGTPAAGIAAPTGAAGTKRRSRRADRADAKAAAKAARARATRLVVLEPKQRRGMTIELAGDVTLGRDPTSTIVIDDDPYVSQLHLRVYIYDEQPMVEDLGSTNGTYYNGAKLAGAKLLHPGDRIQVGTTVIEAQ